MSSTSNAAGILVQYKNKFLLCKRAAFGMTLDGFWCVPAGAQDEGEELLHTAIREFYEETGILFHPFQLGLPVLEDTCYGSGGGKFFLYHYRSLALLHPTLNIEHEGYSYFAADELPKPMVPSTCDVILSLTS